MTRGLPGSEKSILVNNERRLRALEAQPVSIRDGSGFDFLGAWSEDTGQPLVFYLRPDGFVYVCGRIITPNDSADLTVCRIPTNYRPNAAVRLDTTVFAGTPINNAYAFIEIQASGAVVVNTNLATLNGVSVYVSDTYYTEYPN